MCRIFITGSADGLGLMAARLLVAQGHQVVLHARNQTRGKEALHAVPGAEAVVSGDLSSIEDTRHVAELVNDIGVCDAVIHNAAVGYRESRLIRTVDDLPHVFAINSLAPFILTCIISRPKRLIYISSGLHRSGNPSLEDLTWRTRRWDAYGAYADSKLHNVILAFAVARRWPEVLSNAMEPGWVATKMGGHGAPDSLELAPVTQTWLATSQDREAVVSGRYFYHQKPKEYLPAATDQSIQDAYISECARLSEVAFPV
jgi:NAD(P)-dependent dehydrogenase (short-subunit alcohol dehydrogenase family)